MFSRFWKHLHKRLWRAPPTILYHWSTSSPHAFRNNPRFEVATQGRVYAVEDRGRFAATTKSIQAKALLVFAGDAAKLFRPHPWATLSWFKRFYGQYWTHERGDLVWDTADCVTVGAVVLITAARIDPINDPRRWRRQYLRIWGSWMVHALLAMAWFVVLYGLAPLRWHLPLTDWVVWLLTAFGQWIYEHRLWFYWGFPAAVALYIAHFVLMPWLVKRMSTRPELGSDLERAFEEAKARGLLPPDFPL